MRADSTPTQPTTGTAAGIPFVAVPPAVAADHAPMVVALHAFEPPRSEAALAGTLPLASLPAWRFYLGLPMFGARLPEGGVAEVNRRGQADYLIELYGPVVEQAAAEIPRAVSELRERFPVADSSVGVMGVGAGGAAALLALAESRLPIAAAGAVNPIIDPRAVLSARERRLGIPYTWNDTSREVAAWLDFSARAGDLAARRPQPPLLIVSGQQDDVIEPERTRALHDALAAHYPAQALRHIEVPDLAHTMGPEPGLQPGPPAPGNVLADRALVEWFHTHLPLASPTEATVRLS
ncbi:prolyl oligopeptidase family serine peptidase [Streptomonospora wellingtoniae]|uniref:Prolyl oligopeptidase family serine peptidase n=1 Tax=Streptomonospora wellingtoniae TaxID=3075544 RepID=A0ABU2KZP3_9ACTN|nr:prolyl oligopeptidase family serine peptidase [Streptomonospora sp. DSM 45055]MDT0304764.1 prolyl oligopeptidase family serine peptidase [Streptomonospora sp. DSM 45055]